MPKKLEQDLGLPSVLAISIGAMIGSGIFILPALAVKTAGSGVVIAYVLAGLLVVPAALSKSEMATAMPQAGGTYIYIERGMGPLLGTVAGIGTWFALSFKGGLALVGGVPYLLWAFDVPNIVTTAVALGLATVLVLVNLIGAKQTGRLQIAIVGVMLAVLSWFVVGGVPAVDGGAFSTAFDSGAGGIFAATGLVFVSYAGVTKVTSVAEEIENPERNIPLGILGSLAFTTLLYALIVVVMLGVADLDAIAGSATPMIVAARETLGTAGVAGVVIAAILALVSTANAGLLSSSRYPFAMSRDDLAPPSLAEISDRFGTPSRSILLTGAVLLVLIAFVPILEIAKLASAFQILVFVLVNLAVISFRRSGVDYEPTFRSPLYPWMQLFGVVTGLALLTQMGLVAIVGAVVITLGGVAWFYYYGRPRVDREGAAADAVRREVGRKAVDRTRDAVAQTDDYEALVAIPEGSNRRTEAGLLSVAADLARPHDGHVSVVQFDEVADQVPLAAATEKSPTDIEFEDRTDELAADGDVPVRASEIVSHDTCRALANYVGETAPDVLVLEREPDGLQSRLFGSDVEWILEHTDCDAVLVEDRNVDAIDGVTVVTDDGPYDPSKIAVADAIASAHDAAITLEFPLDAGTDDRRATIERYHDEVADLVSVPVSTNVVAPGEPTAFEGDETDLLIVGSGPDDDGLADGLVDGVDSSALVVRPRSDEVPGRLGRAIQRRLF
ncbi:amino acid permease [Natronoarchaeum philippinense]|uniref:amino acid permease n=1 Tax=Natronoarchaeum philippinense TaxID=558529 RepID=UPI000BE480C3|nr:amino acid permease [Natronoarchaeum philippinense]